MTNEELKIGLEIALKSIKEQKQKNFERNKGAGGFITTPAGRENDMYYLGKIEIIEFVLKNLQVECEPEPAK